MAQNNWVSRRLVIIQLFDPLCHLIHVFLPDFHLTRSASLWNSACLLFLYLGEWGNYNLTLTSTTSASQAKKHLTFWSHLLVHITLYHLTVQNLRNRKENIVMLVRLFLWISISIINKTSLHPAHLLEWELFPGSTGTAACVLFISN